MRHLPRTLAVHLIFCLLQDQEEIPEHNLKEGWKLEALNPLYRNQICPATVVKVLNDNYFIVEIDDLESSEEVSKIKFSCHAGSKCIFPAKWCYFKGIPITPPNGKIYRKFLFSYRFDIDMIAT